MKKSILVLSFFLVFFSCKKNAEKIVVVDDFKPVKVVKNYNYEQLKPLLEKDDDTTYIVNFWATWCAPCVVELPYFEKIKKEYATKNVEVLLVSLDFPKQVDKKLIPFINKKKLQAEVVLLDDANEDFWIQAIDESWTGALPATLIYNKKNRKFYEQSFEYETLENELKNFLKL
ncbi:MULTISPECIES: TlpA disulfide reductase family protein [unclassified Polaribacter]|uniref:TlpA disulfide reductase family protein n=1 Tax=unclassified Polaribacter TaxID=196858 RepID=UPI0011BE25E6|nr:MULTISPECIES: TlpA disulfide reductase family protein [unclassified Polaribacter]TXD51953.1 TlpA family protein disulfide reductase [Polaribacter sp. IC063]TXD59703.1 TlpA family protein disulfide reductase [Polaribacter sp. IC066]